MKDSKQHSEADSVSRETALALIEDAKHWSRAYTDARDELRSLQEQLEAYREAYPEIACPNWPHPGITGCVYCAHGEDVLASHTSNPAKERQ